MGQTTSMGWFIPKKTVQKTRETTKTIDVTETYTRVRDMLQFSEGTSIYGQPIIRGAGTRMSVGVPIWYGEDKGDFTFDFALSLGAPLASDTKFLLVRRIWLNDELVLDRSGTGSLAPKRRNLTFTTHAGTPDEAVDPTIAAQAGDDIPAFRGQNTIVIRDLNLKVWGFDTLPVVRVEYSEQSSYNPTYKNFEIPASVTDIGDVLSYGSILIPERNEFAQIYALGEPDFVTRICVWNTKTGKVKLDTILQFRGQAVKNFGSVTFSEDIVYHPHMDRIIFTMRARKSDAVNNAFIVNYETGEVDDCVGYQPNFSAAHRNIENGYSDLQGRQTRPEIPQYTWNRDFRFGGYVNYPEQARELYSTFMPYLHRTQLQKDAGVFTTNDIGDNALGVNTKIACSGDPAAPKPYIDIEHFEEVEVPISDGQTNTVLRKAADPYRREYATFSLFEGRPYHAGAWWDVACFKVKENGVYYWMVCFTQQLSMGGATCTSITYLNNSEYVVGGTSKLMYGNRRQGQTWADAFSLDLQYSPSLFYNYVAYGHTDRSFYCLHSTFAGGAANRVRKTYRINVGMISGGVNPSGAESNVFSFVPGSARFYNQTRTAAIEVIWDNNLTDQEIGDGITFGVSSPDINYDVYRDDRTSPQRFRLEGANLYEGVSNGPQFKKTTLPQATDEDGINPPRHFTNSSGNSYGIQVYEGKFYTGMQGNNNAPARRFSVYGTVEGEPLANLLRALAEDIGFDPSDIIVEGIDDEYWGSIISATTDFWSLVNDLGLLYSFEVFESQGKIKFVKNSVSEDQPITYELTDDDIAPIASTEFGNQSDNDPSLIITRSNEADIPKRVNLTFIDYNDEYRSSQVYTRRQNTTDLNEDDGAAYAMDVPICMSIKEATTRASNVLFDAWNDRITYQIRLPREFMLVEPGDMLSYTGLATIYDYDDDGEVTITTRDTNLIIRSVSCTLNADWSTSLGGKSYYKTTTPAVTIEPPVTRPEDIIRNTGNTEIHLLDIPLLKPEDDQEFVDADNVNIMQEVCYIVVDQDQFTYTDIYRLSNTERTPLGRSDVLMTAGYLVTRLDAVSCPYAIHEVSVEINLSSGFDEALIPVPTYDEFLAGTYMVAVKGSTGWDIFSYRDVQFKDSSVVLTGLIRGRRGSEFHAQNTISTGSPAVFLDGAYTLQSLFGTQEYLAPITVASVLPGGREDDISTDSGYIRGIRHKPFAPSHIKVETAVDGVDISWIRRSRATSTLNNGAPIPLPYLRELRAYEVALFAPDNNTPVLLKDVTDAETVNITAAELTDAGLDGETQLRVSVAQRPEKTGVVKGIPSPIAYYDILDPA